MWNQFHGLVRRASVRMQWIKGRTGLCFLPLLCNLNLMKYYLLFAGYFYTYRNFYICATVFNIVE